MIMTDDFIWFDNIHKKQSNLQWIVSITIFFVDNGAIFNQKFHHFYVASK